MKKSLKQYKWRGLMKEINKLKFIQQNNLPEPGSRVVVAMSGGVDSSVTAALFDHLGYEVIGVTMKLYEEKLSKETKNSKTCCAGIDVADARKVAKKMGIKHYIIDYKDRFRESVINKFVNSYLEGQTPIPCILCNQTVKFTDLLDFTKKLKSEILATGHYVKRIESGKDINLYQADDYKKDQSYFLFSTTQEQLKMLRFPLGNFTKSFIRELAERFGLENFNKPDSQDICFVPDGDYRKFVKKKAPDASKGGIIEDLSGKELGKHKGIVDYTIGQRKGIGIGGIKGKNQNSPLYVLDINRKSNKVIVGSKNELMKFVIYLEGLNLFVDKNCNKSFQALIKIRSGRKLVAAKIEIDKKNSQNGKVQLSEPELGVAPGQACVFYDKDRRMIGGGWITSSEFK